MTTFTRAPASAAGPHIVRLSGPQGMVAAIPQYLGFIPDESLILLCMQHPNGRVGPVVRVDIPPPEYTEALLPMLDFAERYASDVAVVCYHEGPRPTCIDELSDALRARRIPIVATLSVRGQRIRDARSKSALQRDPGIPLLDANDVQAVALRSAAALVGRSPLPSRTALAASVGPTTSRNDALIHTAIDAVEHELASEFDEAGRGLTPSLVSIVDTALESVAAEYVDTGCVIISSAARIIALTRHVACRDLIMARTIAHSDSSIVGLLTTVAAQCPDDVCADLCAVLAGAAYRTGDGALAHCALDRALNAQATHRMSMLLRSAIDAGIPPSALDVLVNIPIPDNTIANDEDLSPYAVEEVRSQS
ncbi:MAG: DUF4192 domain-containing protein [Nakamurella sp.]